MPIYDIAKHCVKTNALHIEALAECPGAIGQTQNGSAGKFKFREGIPESAKDYQCH